MTWSRRRRWTDDDLRAVVAAASSYREAATRLGSSESRRGVKKRIEELGLSVSHFTPHAQPTRWDDPALIAAVAKARSVAQVLGELGLQPAGGNYASIQRHIARLSLDTSHFAGKAWNRGLRYRPRPATNLADLLVRGRAVNSHHLRQRLIREGVKAPACERCGWCEVSVDGRLPLELDHINGDHSDNRIENLRILCPNCHALQPTHRGRNRTSIRTRQAT